jgi:hypothetical protein
VINRRNFLLGAAGVAAAPLLPRFIQSANAATDPRLMYMADMEVSSFSAYNDDGGPSVNFIRGSGNSPTISSQQARAGTRSLKFVLNRETSSNSYRTETTTSSSNNPIQFFKTHWFGFSMYIPTGWEISNTWEVLFQFHHTPVDWSTYKGGFSPVLAIRFDSNSDQYLMRQIYVQTPESQHQPSDRREAFHTILPGAVAPGRWTDWVLEYRPDWRNISDGGIGVTRFWRDGVKVIDYQGPNACNSQYTPYLKFGCYKSAWKDRNHSDPVKERVYYFDEFRASYGDQGSYDLVAPGGSGSTAMPPRPPGSVTVR